MFLAKVHEHISKERASYLEFENNFNAISFAQLVRVLIEFFG